MISMANYVLLLKETHFVANRISQILTLDDWKDSAWT